MTLETRISELAAAVGADVKSISTTLTGKNPSIEIKDGGLTLVSSPIAINFTGTGVTASNNSGVVEVNVPGAAPSSGGTGITYTEIQSALYTAASNTAVRVDSTTGAFTVYLPAAPADSTVVAVFDVTGNCNVNPVLVAPSGSDSVEGDLGGVSIDISGAFLQFVYTSTLAKWTIADTYASGYTAAVLTAPEALSPFLLMGA